MTDKTKPLLLVKQPGRLSVNIMGGKHRGNGQETKKGLLCLKKKGGVKGRGYKGKDGKIIKETGKG